MSNQKSQFNKKKKNSHYRKKSFDACMSRLSSGNSKRRMLQNYNWNTLFFCIYRSHDRQERVSWHSLKHDVVRVCGQRRSSLWNHRLWPPWNPSHTAFPAKLPSTRLCCLLLAIMTACALVANGSQLCQHLERPLPRFLEWGEDTLFCCCCCCCIRPLHGNVDISQLCFISISKISLISLDWKPG